VELHRTTYTADGTVVEFAIGVHAATRFAWAYDFKVPDSADMEGEASDLDAGVGGRTTALGFPADAP
jgi:hypothetical protein